MLNTTYKIVAKLISMWLRKILPQLVNKQQSGFVSGCQILENISITPLAFDWLNLHKLKALFLQHNFEKSFDRVDFKYIWSTLTTVGLATNSPFL